MKTPKVLVLCGDGINCERETAMAFELAGAKAEFVHINDLLKTPTRLKDYQLMALPGGFSFGDELGSGQILALKIKYSLGEEFYRFVDDKKPIIGICNGFQVLTKLGLLPSPKGKRVAALAANESGGFIDRWATLLVEKQSICKWTIRVEAPVIDLPIRHGEGRIVFSTGEEKTIFDSLKEKGQIPFYYSENINGSYGNIAALCDEEGLIMGMMPHPEAYLYAATGKNVAKDPFSKGAGAAIFDSIITYVNGV